MLKGKKSSETGTGRDHRRDREDSHCAGDFEEFFSYLVTLNKMVTKNIKCIIKSVLYKVRLAGRILQTCSAIRLLVRLCLRGIVRDLSAIWRVGGGQGRQGLGKPKVSTSLSSYYPALRKPLDLLLQEETQYSFPISFLFPP